MISSCRELIITTITVILLVLSMGYFLLSTLTFPLSHNQIFGMGIGILLGVILSFYLRYYNKSGHRSEITNYRFFYIIALGGIIGSWIVEALLSPEQEELMIVAGLTTVIILMSYGIVLQWWRWLRLD